MYIIKETQSMQLSIKLIKTLETVTFKSTYHGSSIVLI